MKRFGNQRGQGVTEYAILLGTIALGLIVTITAVGSRLSSMFASSDVPAALVATRALVVVMENSYQGEIDGRSIEITETQFSGSPRANIMVTIKEAGKPDIVAHDDNGTTVWNSIYFSACNRIDFGDREQAWYSCAGVTPEVERPSNLEIYRVRAMLDTAMVILYKPENRIRFVDDDSGS